MIVVIGFWLFYFLRLRLACPRNDGRRASPPLRKVGMPKPPWVKQEVLRLKALTGTSCRKLADLFNRLYAAKRRMTVSSSYVAYTVRDHVYEIDVLRREIKHRIPPPLAKNVIWGVDLTGKGGSNGNVHSILGVLDHGARTMLALEALVNKRAFTLLGHLFLAIGRYGKPRSIRTDNEAVFKSLAFKVVLAITGIRQQFTVPGCPWMNGRIERFFGTLKEKLDQWQVSCREGLQSSLIEFAFWYNHVRSHQHLRGLTPAEAWVGCDPYQQPPKRVDWFEAWDGLLTGFYIRR